MSETVEQGGQAEDGAQLQTAGAMLRQAREAAGLHIAALAVSLKVPVKKLEALEADRLDLLPDAVFVRALASSVCRTLKVDPAPVLSRLPQTAAPRLAHDTSGINAPFRAPSDGPGPSLWDQVSRPAVLAVLALLMGALVLVFLPDIQRQGLLSHEAPEAAVMPASAEASRTDTVISNPPSDVAPAAAQGATLAAPTAMSPAASAPKAASATLATTAPLAPSVALSTPTVASPTLVITPPAQPPAAAASSPAAVAFAPPANGIVVFQAKGPSWVEVTDAKGTVALRRMLAPGESAAASGALPLAVIVGRADSTQVQVRGKPLDLAPLSRDNVARFQVK